MHHRIEEIRTKLQLDKKEFSKRLGITQQAYNNYSKGTRTIPTDILIKIKQLFNISIDWMISGEKQQKVNYKEENIKNIEELDEKQQEYIYHIIKAEIAKKEI